MGQNVNENKAMTKVVIAINNVNENKAMTKVVIATRNAIVSQRCACNDAMLQRVKRRSYSRTIQSNM